ncbi:hypothetical protein J6590_097158, partial [Homalodisca vitripennis]
MNNAREDVVSETETRTEKLSNTVQHASAQFVTNTVFSCAMNVWTRNFDRLAKI